MPIEEFDQLDLGGGLNEGQPWNAIQANEFTSLKNFYPFGRALKLRGGVTKVTTSAAWDEDIYSMFPLKKSDGTWAMLTGGNTKFGKLDGNEIADLGGVASMNAGTEPFASFQYKNYAYMMRPAAGKILRVNESSWAEAGIVAPTAAATIAEGAAGSLTSADYVGVYTFYNSDTGMESNPSSASNTLSLAASKKVDWTGIGTSSDPFVTSRRLYRTLPDQSGEYFFVDEIENNFDTTYTGDDVIIADMGRAVSFSNGLPPALIEVGALWRERHFCSDNKDLYYSEYELPECFDSESKLPIYPDDGHEIRALHSFGDRLIIGKTNKIHYLVGADAQTFNVLTLSDKHGCFSHHSMQSAEGVLFWYGSGNNFYRSDGNAVVEISTTKIRKILDKIPDRLATQVIGAVYPSLSWYIATVPQSDAGDDNNYLVLVYNYKTDSWTVFDHSVNSENAPQFLTDFFDENLEHILYSTFYDKHIYIYNDFDSYLDDGSTFTASFIGRANNFGVPGSRKFFKEVWLMCPKISGGTVTLEVYNDEDTSTKLSRSVSIDISDSAWKAYRLPTEGTPGTNIRFGLQYAGSTAFDVEGIHFIVGTLKRRPMQPV